jgi:hypothetical protein
LDYRNEQAIEIERLKMEDFSRITGQLNHITWGGLDLGANAVVSIPDILEFEPQQPDSMGGEVLCYLLRKKEIIIPITLFETNINVMAAAFGGYWANGTATIDDVTYAAGMNATVETAFTKALVIAPKGVGSPGRLTLEAPYATAMLQRIEELGGGRGIKTTLLFKCAKGDSPYSIKMRRA